MYIFSRNLIASSYSFCHNLAVLTNTQMILNPKIFRAYDIRGAAFIDFDEDGFMAIAHGFGQYLKNTHKITTPKVFVSGDGRQSMPELFPSILSGLTAAGCEVVWGGAIPTPVNYFVFHDGDFDGGIQISASHNPAGDNGLKLTDRSGAVSGDQIQEIQKLAQCVDYRTTEQAGSCLEGCEQQRFWSQYLEKIKQITNSQKPLKLVVDAGNAIPGIFYPEGLRAFEHEVEELYCDLNTTFPNHQPDPERIENLQEIKQAVIEHKADLGFAYDGDGDRVGVILKDGTILNADKILYVLAVDFLSRNPKAPIVLDAMISQTLIEKLKEKGARVILSKTGHSHIEHAMKVNNSLFGGEQSGHFMFGENFYGHDDALLASLRFIQAIETTPKLIGDVTSGWEEMVEFSEGFEVPDESKFQIMDQVVSVLEKKFKNTNPLDGVRIDFGNNEWAIVRASNTSPKISVRIEALDKQSLEEKKVMIIPVLQDLS